MFCDTNSRVLKRAKQQLLFRRSRRDFHLILRISSGGKSRRARRRVMQDRDPPNPSFLNLHPIALASLVAVECNLRHSWGMRRDHKNIRSDLTFVADISAGWNRVGVHARR